MQRYKKIGVYLDGTPADPGALGFAGLLAGLADAEAIVCIYEQADGASGAADLDVSDLEDSIAAALPEDVRSLMDLKVHHGAGVDEVLRSARDLDLDLIVKGRRLPANALGAGTTFTRLARKSPCDVLIVPNQVRPHVGRLLVPVDFSEHSRMALETAIAIASQVESDGEHAQVLVLTTYDVGYGHAKTGLSMQEAAETIGRTTREQQAAFLDEVDFGDVEVDAVCMCTERTSSAAHDLATARKADMIVLGSRGLSATAAAILGSTTEQVIVESALPVLVIKKKGETIGLLNALLDA